MKVEPRNIEYARHQFEITKCYVAYWTAMATTGAAKLRKIERGVEGGGWRELTDEEKVKEALDTAVSHIQRLNELSDFIFLHTKEPRP